MYRPFDPQKDEGRPLLEMQSIEDEDGNSALTIAPSNATFEAAKLAPWYYLVEDASMKEEAVGVASG